MPEGDLQSEWLELLDEEGIEFALVKSHADMDTIGGEKTPQIVFVDFATLTNSDVKECIERCSQHKLPVIGFVPPYVVTDMDIKLELNDFVVSPPDPDELVTRVKQALWRTRTEQGADVIRVGDLAINPSTYEVSLKGKRITLRFKEYELLRLLVSNPGRVYTREALLSSIWGYDYFGGTRTVDVHIRRLRSKIEDSEHPLIETIWNVGYRFRDPREAA